MVHGRGFRWRPIATALLLDRGINGLYALHKSIGHSNYSVQPSFDRGWPWAEGLGRHGMQPCGAADTLRHGGRIDPRQKARIKANVDHGPGRRCRRCHLERFGKHFFPVSHGSPDR